MRHTSQSCIFATFLVHETTLRAKPVTRGSARKGTVISPTTPAGVSWGVLALWMAEAAPRNPSAYKAIIVIEKTGFVPNILPP